MALGAWLPNIKCHTIVHTDISLQVAPVIVQCQEGTAMIAVWNHYTHMQPIGPTVEYLPPWWQTSVCQTYFLGYWKKSPDEQIASPFAESAASSNTTAVNQEWQSVIDAAEAAAAREAQIAIQLHDDAAEARRPQDVFDLLGPGQSGSRFGEISLTTGPFDPPSGPPSLSADVWGPQYPKSRWRPPVVFCYSSKFAMSELPLGFDALHPCLLPPPASVQNTFTTLAQQMPPPIGPGRGHGFTAAPRQQSSPPRLRLSPLVESPGCDFNNTITARPTTLPLTRSNSDHSVSSTAVTGCLSPLDESMEEESRVEIIKLHSCQSSPSDVSALDAASSLLALRNASSAMLPSIASCEPTALVISNELTASVIVIHQTEQYKSAPVHPPLVPI